MASVKQELKDYLQTRYNAILSEEKIQSSKETERAKQEINNIAAKFEIKLK